MAERNVIRIGVLTSSRADFGIYLPLLRAITSREEYRLKIIAFGTHLSKFHGYTLNEIYKQGFEVEYKVSSMLLTDDAGSIATSYGLTVLKFAEFWSIHRNDFDLIFCLGDRYEMAAAVNAGVPHGLRFAHIHGGETTLGAIDNIYRDQITHASSLHFVAASAFKERIRDLVGEKALCFVTGSLSLDNLNTIELLSIEEFRLKWNIDLSARPVLVTIHPETVNFSQNEFFAAEIIAALEVISEDQNVIVTMPNADTNGQIFREGFLALKQRLPGKITLIENFGTQSYFTCMKYADFIIGNTSSGLIEAPSFHKFVINVGSRQLGRLAAENVINVPFDRHQIVAASKDLKGKRFDGVNPYYQGNAATSILNALSKYYESL